MGMNPQTEPSRKNPQQVEKMPANVEGGGITESGGRLESN